jgi:ATP-dependent exoDNAse (exonuclease V) alpha subunit
LFATREQVQAYNIQRATAIAQLPDNYLFRVDAEDNSRDVPFEFQGLARSILVGRGQRVMLTVNIRTRVGLVNGATGTVVDVVYRPDTQSPALPEFVIVAFDRYSGPVLSNDQQRLLVAIRPVTKRGNNRSGQSITRQQLPFQLAWAITIHKAQGATLGRVVVNMGAREFSPDLTFVALSRVRSLQSIAVDFSRSDFSVVRLQDPGNSMRKRKEHEQHLRDLERRYDQDHPDER